jgi:signal transduction histidine kinase
MGLLGRRWPVSVLLSVSVLFTGLAVCGVLAGVVERGQAAHLAEVMDQRAQAVDNATSAETRRYTDTISDLAAAVGAQSELSAADFATLTSRTSRERLPGASGVLLVVPARSDEVGSVQALWRSRGNTDLTLQPHGGDSGTGEHLFSVLNHPLDGTPPHTGRDMTAAIEPTRALHLARSTGQVTASGTYILLKDRQLPADQQQSSFVLAAPVYGGQGTPDAAQFRGWIMMGLRGGDFITETLRQASQHTAVVSLSDTSTAGRPVTVARVADGTILRDARLHRQVSVDIGQRRWQLDVYPTTGIRTPLGNYLPTITAGIGTLLTMLLAALVAVLTTARNRALAQVDKATTALRADIIRRQHVEARLLERETELEAFAGITAHDLKSPLTTVAGYAAVIIDEHGDSLDPSARQYLDRIIAGVTRMRRLIDDLLGYATARDAHLNPTPVDLAGLVTDVLTDRTATLAEPPHIDLGELPTVTADPVLLRQVLDNLIGNALKYVRPGRTPYVAVTARPTTGGWHIEVADRGIGIDPADQGAVFDTFHRARGSEGYPGTGLGLAICKQVITRHGGRIGVTTNTDGGSRFWFTLPATAQPATDDTATPTTARTAA